MLEVIIKFYPVDSAMWRQVTKGRGRSSININDGWAASTRTGFGDGAVQADRVGGTCRSLYLRHGLDGLTLTMCCRCPPG